MRFASLLHVAAKRLPIFSGFEIALRAGDHSSVCLGEPERVELLLPVSHEAAF
jgi:hypothetical protein